MNHISPLKIELPGELEALLESKKTSAAIKRCLSRFLHQNRPIEVMHERLKIHCETGCLVFPNAEFLGVKKGNRRQTSIRLSAELRAQLEALAGVLQVNLKDLILLGIYYGARSRVSAQLDLRSFLQAPPCPTASFVDMYGDLVTPRPDIQGEEPLG